MPEGTPKLNIIQKPEEAFRHQEQRYEKEILSLIEILKPDDVSLEEFENQAMDDLFDDVKKLQTTRGKLIESEEETTKEALSLLKSRIKNIVEDDYFKKDKKESLDKSLVRRAKIALLKTGDYSNLEKYTTSKISDMALTDFSNYLHPYANESDRKLTEHEIDSLIKLNLNKNFLSGFMHNFDRAIEKAPESLLMQAAIESNTDQFYNVKYILENAHSDTPYSKECFKRLLATKQFGALLFEHINEFKDADFKDAVVGRSPEYPFNAGRMVEEMRVMNLPKEKFDSNLDIIVKNQKITDSDWRVPWINEQYGDVIEKVKVIEQQKYDNKKEEWNKVSIEEGLPIAKELIENGNIGFLHEDWRYVKYLVENDYDWLLNQVKKYNQEFLLLGNSKNQHLLKEEDQNMYAKKLLSSGKEYLCQIFTARRDSMFGDRSLDQEVFDKLNKYGADVEPLLFKHLNEETFATLLSKHPGDFDGGGLTKIIRNFDFNEENSKFEDYKKYQKIIDRVGVYFAPATPSYLYPYLDLDFERVAKMPYEELDGILLRQSILFEKVRKICFETGAVNDNDSFLRQYVFLLEEDPNDLEKMVDNIPLMQGLLIAKPPAYVEGLKTFAGLDEEKKKELKEKLEMLYKNNDIFKNGEGDLMARYFKLTRRIESKENLITSINDIPKFTLAYKDMSDEEKKLWNEVFPWAESLEKIEGIQKQSKREEYDPWRTQFLPMLDQFVKDRTISMVNKEDGKLVLNYFERFGMKNISRIFPLFVEIYRSNNVDSVPVPTKEILKKSFNIDADDLCKNDKTNIKLILSELEKMLPKMIGEFRSENPAFVTSVIESPYAMSLFKSIVGDSGHSHGVNTEEALKIYTESLIKSPEKFKLPEGYQEVQIAVPEIVLQEGEKEEKIEQEKKKLFDNLELKQVIKDYKETVNEVEGNSVNSLRWVDGQCLMIVDFFSNAMREYQARLIEEKNKEIPNQKAIIGLEKRIQDYKKKQRTFQEQFEMLNKVDVKRTQSMEMLFNSVPDEWSGKKNLLMSLSLLDMSIKVKEGYDALIADRNNSDPSMEISKYYEFIANHVKEHYLDKKHGLESSIETEDKNLIKALKKYWGTQDFEKSILSISNEKLKMLEKGEISDKTKTISLIPSKGLQRIFSGDLGKACTSRQNGPLAEGEFPEIISYSFVTDKETKNEKFAGSFLVVETEDVNGEKTMVLRANNPQQNLFNMVDGDSLIKSIISEVKDLAKRRGINNVVVPLQGGANSNRTEISTYYKKFFQNNEKIELKNSLETNFNGYDIWKKESINAVVKI